MTETKRDYEIGYRKPPEGRRFKKGQSGNPSGGRAKSAKGSSPLLLRKFDEQVVVATNGRRQKTTRREVLMVQLVDQPAGAGLSSTKFLTELLKEIAEKAGPRNDSWIRPLLGADDDRHG